MAIALSRSGLFAGQTYRSAAFLVLVLVAPAGIVLAGLLRLALACAMHRRGVARVWRAQCRRCRRWRLSRCGLSRGRCGLSRGGGGLSRGGRGGGSPVLGRPASMKKGSGEDVVTAAAAGAHAAAAGAAAGTTTLVEVPDCFSCDTDADEENGEDSVPGDEEGQRGWARRSGNGDTGGFGVRLQDASASAPERALISSQIGASTGVADSGELVRRPWALRVLGAFAADTLSRYALLASLLFALPWVLFSLAAFDYVGLAAPLPVSLLWTAGWWVLLLPPRSPVELPALRCVPPSLFVRLLLALVWHELSDKFRRRRVALAGGCAVLCALVLVLFVGFAGVCIPSEPTRLGSTRFVRLLFLRPRLCSDASAAPCHVYLTLPEDAGAWESVVVGFQTAGGAVGAGDAARVVYDTVSHGASAPADAYAFSTNGTSYLHSTRDFVRGVHWVQLRGLASDTVHFFRCGAGSGADLSEELSFRTLPERGAIRLVVGGDAGITAAAVKVGAVAAAQQPHVAALGGDLAYANAFDACFYVWDEFLSNFYRLWREAGGSGRLVPLVFAAGNHETGGTHVARERIPFYTRWFQQQAQGVSVADRRTYHFHRLTRDLLLLALDSAVSAPPDGEQLAWMRATVARFANATTTTMALYHMPLYPAVRDPDVGDSRVIHDTWRAFFDEHVDIAFENHDHVYKRTPPLRADAPAQGGVLYVGDGAWGAAPRELPRDPRWYIAVERAVNYVLRVDIGSGGCANMSALDASGGVIDQFSHGRC